MKGREYAEIIAVQSFLPAIEIKQFGLDCFIVNEPKQADIDIARAGLEEVKRILKHGEYDLVILDEANIALFYKLFTSAELIDAIRNRKPEIEVIITGRYAPPEIIENADLVTEMKEVKHYYNQGIEARQGIEY